MKYKGMDFFLKTPAKVFTTVPFFQIKQSKCMFTDVFILIVKVNTVPLYWINAIASKSNSTILRHFYPVRC